MNTFYQPGTWLGLTHRGTWILVEAKASDPVVPRWWQLVQSGADADQLASSLAPADFALAQHRDGRTRIIVHGVAAVQLQAADGGPLAVSSECWVVESWAELQLSAPRGTLDGIVLPLESGAVFAATLTVEAAVPTALSLSHVDRHAALGSQYDHMFEASIARPAPVVEDDFASELRPGPVIQLPLSSRQDQIVVPDGLIEDVSWAEPGASPPPLVRQAARQESTDDLELTVYKGPSASPMGEPDGPGPLVSAVHCPQGHSNPTEAQRCRICATPVAVQPPKLVRRPMLGVLRLSDGDTIRLDRGIILGRAPGEPHGSDGPHRFRILSPDNSISREHAEVRLDGWQVVVVDLGSRNGTVVTLPGGMPERLCSGVGRVLEPGSVVTLADTVSFRFEVAA